MRLVFREPSKRQNVLFSSLINTSNYLLINHLRLKKVDILPDTLLNLLVLIHFFFIDWQDCCSCIHNPSLDLWEVQKRNLNAENKKVQGALTTTAVGFDDRKLLSLLFNNI